MGFDRSKGAVKDEEEEDEEDWDCEERVGFCSSSLKSEMIAIGELREECLPLLNGSPLYSGTLKSSILVPQYLYNFKIWAFVGPCHLYLIIVDKAIY